MDSALCLFRIARIVGSTLEDLYTTTQRRGASKILRLLAELDKWWSTTLIDNEVNTNDTCWMHSEAALPQQSTLAITFINVAHLIATIRLHRPLLAFTT